MRRTDPGSGLARRRYKVLLSQLVIGLIVAVAFLWFRGIWQAESALYGAGVNIIIALLLGRGVARAGQAAAQHAQTGMLILIIGVIQRFLLVLSLFGIGFALLKLNPLACIVGFGLTQLGYLISARES